MQWEGQVLPVGGGGWVECWSPAYFHCQEARFLRLSRPLHGVPAARKGDASAIKAGWRGGSRRQEPGQGAPRTRHGSGAPPPQPTPAPPQPPHGAFRVTPFPAGYGSLDTHRTPRKVGGGHLLRNTLSAGSQGHDGRWTVPWVPMPAASVHRAQGHRPGQPRAWGLPAGRENLPGPMATTKLRCGDGHRAHALTRVHRAARVPSMDSTACTPHLHSAGLKTKSGWPGRRLRGQRITCRGRASPRRSPAPDPARPSCPQRAGQTEGFPVRQAGPSPAA